MTLRILRAKAEQMAPVTKVEVRTRKAMVDPEQQRTKVEPECRRRLTKSDGWRDEAQHLGVEARDSGLSTTDQGGA